ncbi:hypothetical protein [Niabella aquatica]
MKHLFILLLIACTLFSCSKNKDDVKQPEKKYFLSRTNTVSGTYSGTNEYTWNDQDRLTGQIQDKGRSSETVITYDYDSKGNITSLRYPNLGSNRWEYAYDAQGRLATKQGYNNDGAKGILYQYNYYADRVEEVLPGGAKYVYTWSADKKSVASYKTYNSSGTLVQEYQYVYSKTVKNAYYGSGQVSFLNKSDFATESYVITNYYNGVAGTPVTYTYTYEANSDGYPVTSSRRSSDNSTVYTTIYEYIIK